MVLLINVYVFRMASYRLPTVLIVMSEISWNAEVANKDEGDFIEKAGKKEAAVQHNR